VKRSLTIMRFLITYYHAFSYHSMHLSNILCYRNVNNSRCQSLCFVGSRTRFMLENVTQLARSALQSSSSLFDPSRT